MFELAKLITAKVTGDYSGFPLNPAFSAPWVAALLRTTGLRVSWSGRDFTEKLDFVAKLEKLDRDFVRKQNN